MSDTSDKNGESPQEIQQPIGGPVEEHGGDVAMEGDVDVPEQQEGDMEQQEGGEEQQEGEEGQQVGEEEQQAGGEEQQAGGEEQQAGGEEQQADGEGQQVGGEEQQAGGEEHQAGEEGQQVGEGGQQAGGEGQQEGTKGQQESAVGQQEGGEGQQVGGEGQQEGTEGEQEGAEGQQEGAEGQQKGAVGQQETVAEGTSALRPGHLQAQNKAPPGKASQSIERQNTTSAKGRAVASESRSFSARRRVYSTLNLEPIYTINNLTTGEEYATFRARNRVAPNYRGPVFVVEDVHVMCAQCGAPVDPITRVPAGKMFFHPQCISCKLCGRANITEAYFKGMRNGAICSECAVRGYAWWVPREAVLSRGMIPGAIRGPFEDSIDAYDSRCRLRPINQSTVEGAIPPTLALGPLYERLSHPVKMLSLIQRQQYYTQNDNNIICIPPTKPKKSPRTPSGGRQRETRTDVDRLL